MERGSGWTLRGSCAAWWRDSCSLSCEGKSSDGGREGDGLDHCSSETNKLIILKTRMKHLLWNTISEMCSRNAWQIFKANYSMTLISPHPIFKRKRLNFQK